jgi:Zn-dependent protease
METQAREPAPPQQGRERGLVLGRPWGVPIVLAPSWFIVAALITVLFAPAVESQLPGSGPWAYAIAALFAVLLYASVLIHELGHVAVARHYGVPVRRITLQLLGGVSELEGEMTKPSREFWVAVAGPALSLALGLLGWALLATLDPTGVLRLLLLQLTAANLLVGVFNLLPGLPLDGGHVVRAAVWSLTGRAHIGTRAAGWSGRVVAAIAFATPFLIAAATGTNGPSLTSVLWAAAISAFVWVGASAALRSADQAERIPAVNARALVRRAIPVDTGTPLALALDQLTRAQAGGLVIVDRAGQPRAIVNEAAVAAVPLERRPWVPVDSVARRVESTWSVPVDAAGRDLLELVARAQAPELLVVDDAQRIVGVLAVRDVEAALRG